MFEELVRLEAEGGGDSSPTSPLRRQTSSTTGCIFNELIRTMHLSTVPSFDHNLSPPPTSPTASSSRDPPNTHAHAAGGVVAERGDGGRGTVSYVWQFSRYLNKLVNLLVKCLNGNTASK